MEKNILLKNKNAAIYGASGAIGGAVARAFASQGAKVFLSGRSRGFDGGKGKCKRVEKALDIFLYGNILRKWQGRRQLRMRSMPWRNRGGGTF